MAANKTDIFVYAHWIGMSHPELLGVLSAHQAKGRKAFSFEYNKSWLKTNEHHLMTLIFSSIQDRNFQLKKRISEFS